MLSSAAAPDPAAGPVRTTTTTATAAGVTPVQTQIPKKARKPTHPVVRWYLFGYNTVCFFLWGVTLATLFKFLLLGPSKSVPSTVHGLVTQWVLRLTKVESRSLVPFEWSGSSNAQVAVLVWHMQNVHAWMGDFVAAAQSLAVLEVVHALVGFVRSPVPTTAIQVGSRLWSVWGVANLFPSAAASPLYATMIFAWAVTETIRYAFYAEQLLIEKDIDSQPSWQLLWARYTTFYLLYPLGAGSEAACMVYTLPWFNSDAVWDVRAYAYLGLAIIWIPGLAVMYIHMLKQRRKVLGKGIWGDKLLARIQATKDAEEAKKDS